MSIVEKIISGGQTGADQGGLEAGKELGLVTGGTAPQGWRTERGPMKELLYNYGLNEAGMPGYPFRTKMNVLNSDATVIFGSISGPGSALTMRLCVQHGRPVYTLTSHELTNFTFVEWLAGLAVKVLNVAGNRESRNLGIQERVRNFLVAALR